MAKLLSETTFFESSPSIDAENGILRGVKLLGLISKNGREYKLSALEAARSFYDGRQIYIDHPRRSDMSEDRQMESLAGEVRNPHVKADGLYGDAHLLKETAFYKKIVEASQRFPKMIGFSHVANGDSTMHGEKEIVESITEVFSVDLVTTPATTKGLFESVETGKEKKTLRQAVESLPASNPVRTKLIEGMDAGLFDGGMTVGEGGESKTSDPLTLIYNALQKVLDALVKVVGSKDMADATKNQQPPQTDPAQQQNTDPAKQGKPGSEADPAAVDQKKRIESLEQRLALADAKNALVESGVEATDIRVKKLAETTEAADRKALIESWPKKNAANLQESAGSLWPESSPPANGSGGDAATSDSKYAERFSESAKRAKDRVRQKSAA